MKKENISVKNIVTKKKQSKKTIIIAGSTGMVGNQILRYALDSKEIKKVIVINRHSLELEHPKLVEIIHYDFFIIIEPSTRV